MRRFAATLGKRYDQDGVATFHEGDGEGFRCELRGVDRAEALPATVKHDLPGGMLRGNTLEILDADGSDFEKVDALSGHLGVTIHVTPGHVEFLERDDYETILSRSGETPPDAPQDTPEGRTDSGHLPAQDRGPPDPATEVARPTA